MSIESFSKDFTLKTEKEVASFIEMVSNASGRKKINRDLICHDKVLRGEEKVKLMIQRKTNK
jgi:hypothetical protein